MQDIIQHLAKDRDILGPLLKTSYFTWQSKYLESMAYLGDICTPKKKPWQVRDIILLIKSQLSKVQLVTALIKHSKTPGTLRYMLNEKELLEVGNLINRSDGDFVKDFLTAAELHSAETLKKAKQFVYFLEPSLRSSHSLRSLPSKKQTDFETTFSQVAGIMESATGTKFDKEPLKPLISSLNAFIYNSKSTVGDKSDTELMNNVIQNIYQYVGSVSSQPKQERGYVEEVSSEEYGQLTLGGSRK